MPNEKKPKTKCVEYLRHAEYYDMQNTFDELYARSQAGEIFENLMDVILSRENILLAYRNIKSNTGSITPGTDKLKISDIGKLTADEVTARVRKIVKGAKNGYTPRSVRRKDIPKPNGNTRPLGIPCIWDRLVQQCIKQVMEPICEARFSNNSYGFRPNRSVENAIAAIYRLMQRSGLYYVVEFDIKGEHQIPVRVSIPGKFNVYNALAAAAVTLWVGVPAEKLQHALEHLKINGRMEIVYTSEKCCVIVDYAHNAVSMESLLATLREYHPKRLVVVFGCGGNRSKDRRYSMGEIGGRMADLSIITADNSRFEKVEDIIADIRGSIEKTGGKFIEIPDRKEAIAYSITHAEPGDMIAIIGKGHEDYQEINGVRYPFLDRAVVEEVVKNL